MILIDFVTAFSPHSIAEPDSSLAELLEQLDAQNTTLALATSRRGLLHQVNSEAIAETLEFTAPAAGKYEYVCTFPGHFAGMRGIMVVE